VILEKEKRKCNEAQPRRPQRPPLLLSPPRVRPLGVAGGPGPLALLPSQYCPALSGPGSGRKREGITLVNLSANPLRRGGKRMR